ncbi:MAG: glycerol kinase GlpK [Myxococcota bacterium]|nr:glycerol kinase GlpK [Myxococcota bacterium]
MRYILAIDQGTTGSTVLVIDENLGICGRHTEEFPQIYPQPGWVEHDPDSILASVKTSVVGALHDAKISAEQVTAIGITNQRETTVLWDRTTGKTVHNAIVWQCRRTTDRCHALKEAGLEPMFKAKTGLVLDPYFSGTKLTWLLDHVEGARTRAERGELAFGTIDTFLVWQLTNGASHVTDVSNACRTLLMNLQTLDWDRELLDALQVPDAVLPQICSSSEVYGVTADFGVLPDGIPIAGMAGDQQAALFGQACFGEGEAKCTYGTGCFLLMNTGTTPIASDNGLLTSVGWKIGHDVTYVLEGSAFVAGAAVQWLRDGLGLIDSAAAIESLALSVEDSDGVYFVPALTGLGTPYWNPDARGLICGLTRGSTAGHIARATLEGIAYQNLDILTAMTSDSGHALKALKVDGGAAVNEYLMQFQADLLGVEIIRPKHLESTALGAAFLAGIAVGIWQGVDDVKSAWLKDKRFLAQMPADEVEARLRGWHSAVNRA